MRKILPDRNNDEKNEKAQNEALFS